MLKRPPSKIHLLAVLAFAIFFSGCDFIRPKVPVKRAILLKTENATQEELIGIIGNFTRVESLRAKIYLQFEDNSYAEAGIAEKYKTADGQIVVQRPANILLRVQVPVIGTDVAQMTSDGDQFRVAILEDGGSGKYRAFISGTNDTDYSQLRTDVINRIEDNGNVRELKQNVNAFSNLRPQHFTDALLVRPIDSEANFYVQSTIMQEEVELDKKNKKLKSWFLRGYYLLDEHQKLADGSTKITRRFWFDRVDRVRLARQQIFDSNGEIESDVVYGQEGAMTESGNYILPLEIILTRPKEKYKMRIRYKAPNDVEIGRAYPPAAFLLENTWDNLPIIDLDKKLQEMTVQQPGTARPPIDAKSQ